MKKLSKKQKLIILISAITIVVIIGIVVGVNAIRTNIANGNYESSNSGSNNGNLLPKYIKKGVTLGGVTGTLESLNTFDATATAEDIAWGETAYVKGKKIIGTRLRKVDDVTIPYGFFYVGGRKDTGIVISDSINDEDKYANYSDQANIPADGIEGNQFVWVPVEKIDNFKRYIGYIFAGEFNVENYWNYLSEPAGAGYGYSTEIEDYNTMYASIEKNKGFYVARFEAGNDNGEVVSKKGIMPWNNVQWGDSMTEIGTTGAVAKSKEMYTNKEIYGVTSTLIYGIQWDAIMSWIDPNYMTHTCDTSNSFVAYSYNQGNYTKKLLPCGSSDNYRVKNIYDLAGNVDEWTMEVFNNSARIDRGGNYENYVNNENEVPASARVALRVNNSGVTLGFRVALYL